METMSYAFVRSFISMSDGGGLLSFGDGGDLLWLGDGSSLLWLGDGGDLLWLGDGGGLFLLGDSGPRWWSPLVRRRWWSTPESWRQLLHIWNPSPQRRSRESSGQPRGTVQQETREDSSANSSGVAGGEGCGASDVGDTHQDT